MTCSRRSRRSRLDPTPTSSSSVWSSRCTTGARSSGRTSSSRSRTSSAIRSSRPRSARASASKRVPPTRSPSSRSLPTRPVHSSTTNSLKRSWDVSRKAGLPLDKRMRHDTHFVEEVTSGKHTAIGRLVDIDKLEPNPHQPRRQFGDLSDLVASIKEKGVLEPILVRAHGERFQIIAGERRYQASVIAGLSQIPCVEIDVDNRGSLEISLIENLQRKDLTPFEEAAALQRLCDQFAYTHDQLAPKLGKSRTSITETVKPH